MKSETGYKIRAHIKKTGTQIAAALEEIEKSALLSVFNIFSLCTSIALSRFSQNNPATDNGNR